MSTKADVAGTGSTGINRDSTSGLFAKSGSVSAMGIFCQLTNACLCEVALCRRALKFRAGSRCDGELICGYISGVRAPGLMVGNGADGSSSIGG